VCLIQWEIRELHILLSERVYNMVIAKILQINTSLTFQGDSGGPLQVMNKDGRYVLIGMNAITSNLSIELDI
jgi:hypothetical protein